jgi:type VI secretion system secreted protein Hcp
LKINGVDGDATADAFEVFSVDDIGAQTSSGTPQTFSFNVKELKTSAAVSRDPVSNDIVSNDIASSAGLSAVSAAALVPASSPLQYFLKIDGVSGDATAKGFEGWFSIDGYDIGVQNTASFSTGGGGGAGKAVFSPLTVDIHSLAGLSTLFGDVASGRHIKFVELVGAASIKDQSVNVYDVKLSDVLVSSFANDPGANGVETSLSFNYSKISLTDQPVTGHGLLGAPQTFSFDVSELKTDAAVSSDIASQINQMAMGLASFMASSQLGSSGSQDVVSAPSTQQQNQLPTLVAAHG